MIRFMKNGTVITLGDGVERTRAVEAVVDEVLRYQICHPVRVRKSGGRIRLSRVPADELRKYRRTSEPVLIPVDGLTAVLYPSFGCRKEDLTEEDMEAFLEFILEPVFIGRDEDGTLYVAP